VNIIARYNGSDPVSTTAESISDACSGGTCPAVYLTDDEKVVVQGGIVESANKSALKVPGHEDVVILDRAVFEKIARQFLA
jgi:hypothetical protein